MRQGYRIERRMTAGKRIRLRVRAVNDNRTEQSERAEMERVQALVVQLWATYARLALHEPRG